LHGALTTVVKVPEGGYLHHDHARISSAPVNPPSAGSRDKLFDTAQE